MSQWTEELAAWEFAWTKSSDNRGESSLSIGSASLVPADSQWTRQSTEPEHSLQDQWMPVLRWKTVQFNTISGSEIHAMTNSQPLDSADLWGTATLRINLFSKICQCAYIHFLTNLAPEAGILAGAPCTLDNCHWNGAGVKASAAGWGFAGEGNKHFNLHLKREDQYMWPLMLMMKSTQW